MTVQELVLALRKHPARSRVDIVVHRGDEQIYTEAASVGIAKNGRGEIIVEISNEV